MKLDITPHQFLEFSKKAYSLDMIFMMKLIEAGSDVTVLCDRSARVRNVYQGLERKGLITSKGEISLYGKALLEFSETKTDLKLPKKESDDAAFKLWWSNYPGTDTFDFQGKHFKGSRALRVNKVKCEEKFNKILEEGEYTSNQLIDSMKLDVLQKKHASIKARTNKVTYMQNSLTYLNQRSFEPFIELINKGVTLTTSSRKSREIDI